MSIAVLAAAPAPGEPGPLQTALLAVWGAALLTFGLLLVTDFRGFARWWMSFHDSPPRWTRRLNIRLFGSEQRYQHYQRVVMPRAVGTSFAVAGGALFLFGVIRLLSLA
jgi:hypothetical protein